MSDKLRAAAQAALKLLDDDDRDCAFAARILKAALEESLTVAEPVAWKHPDKNMVFWEDTKKVDQYHGFKSTIPLYTAPPRREWVGLTDDEVNLIYADPQTHAGQYARAIEAKLRGKNT